MFIYVNDVPINVFSIRKINNVCLVGPKMYTTCMEMWCREWSRDELDLKWLYDCGRDKDGKIKGIKPFHKVLKYVDEALQTIEGEGIASDSLKRYKSGEEINWKIIPDVYLFGITFDGSLTGDYRSLVEQYGVEKFTGAGNDICIYSDMYFDLDQATKAREALVDLVEVVKQNTPRIKI